MRLDAHTLYPVENRKYGLEIFGIFNNGNILVLSLNLKALDDLII